jgi:hypothetical protein
VHETLKNRFIDEIYKFSKLFLETILASFYGLKFSQNVSFPDPGLDTSQN